MPFESEIEIDAGRSLVGVLVTGVVSDDDLIQGTEDLRVHPDFRAGEINVFRTEQEALRWLGLGPAGA